MPPPSNGTVVAPSAADTPSTSKEGMATTHKEEGPPTTSGEAGQPPAEQNGTVKHSAAAKFGLITRLLKQNKVADVNQTQAQTEQNDFMQRYSNNYAASTSQPAEGPVAAPRGLRIRLHEFFTTTIIDPAGDTFYYWTVVVTMAFCYNLLTVIARQVFSDLIGPNGVYMCYKSKDNPEDTTLVNCDDNSSYYKADMTRMPLQASDDDFGWSEYWHWRLCWIIADILMDIIYWIDFFVSKRTGYLDQGLLVKDVKATAERYKTKGTYWIDVLGMLPIDYLLGWPYPFILRFTSILPLPIVRITRLLRFHRVSACLERTETRSSIPNVFRVFCVIVYIIVIIHWNACIYFGISELFGLGSDGWVYGHQNKQSLPEGVEDTLLRRYIYSFYWSTLILTTIGEVPPPVKNLEFMFVTLDLMCGVLIFATIVGNVGSMISNMSAARTEFQNTIDGIKQYMELRKVNKQLEGRVIKWFDYLWSNKQSLADQEVLKVLPDKLQAEIAMHVHFETLRKVRIFQDCEAGLLAELVLKLQQQVFSPGDYICRKGDIGREMYIVKRGKLEVVGDDLTKAPKVFVTLQEGSVFGELSILNIAGSKNGNRRTANVRSVGYTDLFVLNKQDLWSALKEYPEARRALIKKGRDILLKDGLLDETAPQEQPTAEEFAENLTQLLKILQTKMAKLIAEHTSTESKLHSRIEQLEDQLQKYRNLTRRQRSLHAQSMDSAII